MKMIYFSKVIRGSGGGSKYGLGGGGGHDGGFGVSDGRGIDSSIENGELFEKIVIKNKG